MAEVIFRLKGEEASAVRSFLKVHEAQKKTARGAKDVASATKQSDHAMSQLGGTAAREARNVVAGLTGIASAAGAFLLIARQLKAEYENIVRRQQEAAEAQLTAEQLRNRALYNLPSDMTPEGTAAMIERISKKTNVRQEELWGPAGKLLSSKGALTGEQFEQAFMLAATAGAKSGIDIGELGGGIQDVMKLTGATAPQAAGFLRQAGVALRVSELEEQVRTIVPLLKAGAIAGISPEESVELAAAVTQLTADPTGRVSSTAALKLIEVLGEGRDPDKGLLARYAPGGTVGERKVVFDPLTKKGMAGFAEWQEAFAAADERLQMAMLGKVEGKARGKVGPQLLLQREPGAMAIYEAAQRQVGAPTGEGVEESWQSWLGGTAVGANPYAAVGEASRIMKQTTERLRLESPEAMAGALRQEIPDLLRAAGESNLAQKFAKMRFEFGTGFGRGEALEQTIEQLRDVAGGRSRYVGWEARGAEPRPLNELPEGAVASWGGGWYAEGVGFIEENKRYNPQLVATLQGLIESMEALKKSIDESRGEGVVTPTNAQTE